MTLRIAAEGKTASKQGKFVSRHVKWGSVCRPTLWSNHSCGGAYSQD